MVISVGIGRLPDKADIFAIYTHLVEVCSIIVGQWPCIYVLLFFFTAQIGYLTLCSLQGGDEIDDIFGCSTVDSGAIEGRVVFADTYNVAGGDRQNVGDNAREVYLLFSVEINNNSNNPLHQQQSQGQAHMGISLSMQVSCIIAWYAL